MPELPEVQTIVNDLNQKIAGETITDFWTDWGKAIKKISQDKFSQEIKNRKIIRARRIGKNMFIDLSGGKTLYIHLKMTGHLLVKEMGKKPARNASRSDAGGDYFDDRVNQYIHHIFYLGKNKTLEFSDLRKFGKIMLEDTKKISELSEIKKLGADVVSPDFSLNKFREILEKKKKNPIGILLMDQESMSGIGNIYRSEILFEAGISPDRKTGELKEAEIKTLYKAIGMVIKKAIRLRGTSDSDYRDTSGAPGRFHKVLKVYRKTGLPCKKCGTIIVRKKMGQRSAFYCPSCQNH